VAEGSLIGVQSVGLRSKTLKSLKSLNIFIEHIEV